MSCQLCGDIVRPGEQAAGSGCKIPTGKNTRKPGKIIPLGSLNEAGTLLDSYKRYRQEVLSL